MPSSGSTGGGVFATTHWSVVVTAGDSASANAHEALQELCRTYWYPLYAFVRRQGHTPEDAQDLTQAFFARLLEKKYFRAADRNRGRFRTFLLTSLKHFLIHEWHRARALKRGGGQAHLSWDAASGETRYQLEPASELPAEKIYDQRWALSLFQKVLAQLRQEYVSAGKSAHFEELKRFLTEIPDEGAYMRTADRLHMAPASVAVAVHRLRHHYGELVREEIAHTVSDPREIQGELCYLIELVSQ